MICQNVSVTSPLCSGHCMAAKITITRVELTQTTTSVARWTVGLIFVIIINMFLVNIKICL